MSDVRPSERSEPTIALRDILVERLLADLATPGDPPVPLATLRTVAALDGADASGADADVLAVLAGDRAQHAVARALLARYVAALARAPRGADLVARLGQARVLLAEALFYEVHEVLEPPWRDAAGEERRLLQGIIQAAVAWHHGARGRAAPALRAAAAAAAKLSAAPASWHGFPVAALRELLEAYRAAVVAGAPPAPPPVAP